MATLEPNYSPPGAKGQVGRPSSVPSPPVQATHPLFQNRATSLRRHAIWPMWIQSGQTVRKPRRELQLGDRLPKNKERGRDAMSSGVYVG